MPFSDVAPTGVAASAAQIRAARGMLNWSQKDLADNSGVARRSIAAFELGQPVGVTIQKKISDALKKAGIVFIAPGNGLGLIYVPTFGGDPED